MTKHISGGGGGHPVRRLPHLAIITMPDAHGFFSRKWTNQIVNLRSHDCWYMECRWFKFGAVCKIHVPLFLLSQLPLFWYCPLTSITAITTGAAIYPNTIIHATVLVTASTTATALLCASVTTTLLPSGTTTIVCPSFNLKPEWFSTCATVCLIPCRLKS